MEVKLRKYRNNMVTSGWAVVVLCSWDVIRLVLSLFCDSSYKEVFSEMLNIDDRLLFIFVLVFTLLFLGIILFFQLVAGLGGVSEGKGGKKRNVYLVFCVMAFLMSAYSVWSSVSDITRYSFELTMSSLILDLTTAVALGDLFISALVSRHLAKKIGEA